MDKILMLNVEEKVKQSSFPVFAQVKNMSSQLENESLNATASLLEMRDKLNEINEMLDQIKAKEIEMLDQIRYKMQNFNVNFGKKDD